MDLKDHLNNLNREREMDREGQYNCWYLFELVGRAVGAAPNGCVAEMAENLRFH